MRTSSTDPATAPTTEAVVRPVSFDRPLRVGTSAGGARGLSGLDWHDDATEARIQRTIERARTQGQAEGYAKGWAQGRKAAVEREQAESLARAEADRDRHRGDAARIEAALAMLIRATRTVDQSLAPGWDELADVLTDGALAIARAALGRELSGVDAPVVDAVRAALHALDEPGDVVLRLNPAELATVEQFSDAAARPGVRLVPDAAVEPGAVLALTPAQRLHLSLPTAIAAAEQALRS